MSVLTQSTQATPSTPASGLVKMFVNTSKRLSQVDDAGVVSTFATQPGAGAVLQSSPADPAGTANTGGLMMGLAGTITPVTTGRIHVTITGTIKNATAIADGANVQLRTGTGSAPANADALTGTTAGGLVKYVAPTTACKVPFTLCAIVTGLSLNVARWIDVSLAAVTGGTAEITDISMTAYEF